MLAAEAIALPVAPVKTQVEAAQTNFYTSLTQLLQRHVQQGRVNYTSLRQDKEALRQLVNQIGAYDLSRATSAEKKAFYLNAYNLLVLHQVLEHYPIKSVMDVEGFFDRQEFTVAGEKLTLNELERQKLLKPYQDARVHFALVCAAASCPPLLSQAYTPAKVEQQLQEQTESTLQSSQFIKVQPGQKRVLVSEIFKWYKDDFLREAPSILAYINRYRSAPLPSSYSLAYYPYNWQLNSQE